MCRIDCVSSDAYRQLARPVRTSWAFTNALCRFALLRHPGDAAYMSRSTSNVSPAVSCQSFECSLVWLRALTVPVGMRMLVTFIYDLPAKSLLSNRRPSGRANSMALSAASHTRKAEPKVNLRKVTVTVFSRDVG